MIGDQDLSRVDSVALEPMATISTTDKEVKLKVRSVCLRVLVLAFGVIAAPQVRADAVIYSNITNFTGQFFTQGFSAQSGSDTITSTAADDITPMAGSAGNVVDGFTFTVANSSSSAVTARPIIEFWSNNGAGGGPGTLLTAFAFNPIAFAGDVAEGFTFDPGTPLFTVPASGTFWAGITFDNDNGTTGATASQLNLLGQGIFAPPTVGSSQDQFFQTTSGGAIPGSNPAGSLLSFSGNPVADFGWEFLANNSVPEPSTLLLSSIAAVAGLGVWARRRTKVV
jgi:hypothetical protein